MSTLSPSLALSLSLPMKESEKMREEVKEVRGTMWLESLTQISNAIRQMCDVHESKVTSGVHWQQHRQHTQYK